MAAAAALLLLMALGGAAAQVFPPWNGTFPGFGAGSGGGGAGAAAGTTATGVPAMFVFGDSLTDNGNNNDLQSLAKANYPPYGIDFAGGPTGRFSNGYTMVDEIGTCMHATSIIFYYFLALCLLSLAACALCAQATQQLQCTVQREYREYLFIFNFNCKVVQNNFAQCSQSTDELNKLKDHMHNVIYKLN
jgi:phospholipase/lecithinase/hemolysin